MKKRKVLSAVLTLNILCSAMVPVAWANDVSVQAVESVDTQGVSEEPTVTGGQSGVDYIFDGSTLTILTSKPMTISWNGGDGSVSGNIVVEHGVTANLTFNNVFIQPLEEESTLSIEGNAVANVVLKSNTKNYLEDVEINGELCLSGNGRLDCTNLGMSKQEGKLKINDGEINASNYLAQNIVIDNGILYIGNSLYADNCTINGGFPQEPAILSGSGQEWIDEIEFHANDMNINGGTFARNGSLEKNTVFGQALSEGKKLRVTQFTEDSRIFEAYQVVNENDINSFSVKGSGYKYENRVLSLSDGAQVTISSTRQVNDLIEVGNERETANATIILDNVDVYTASPAIRIYDGSSLTLKLQNGSTNILQSVGWKKPAIDVRPNSSIVIDGSGSLQTLGNGGGIVGDYNSSVNIKSGKIIAKSVGELVENLGTNPGIGGSKIIISGGNIITEGGTGIGGNGFGTASQKIQIDGGTIQAIGHMGAAIGNANFATGGSIVINAGDISALTDNGGAAIGSGVEASFDRIEINGGNIVAETNSDLYNQGGGAAIGLGWTRGNLDDPSSERNISIDSISINGGHIIADADVGAAAIGGGKSSDGYITSVGSIDITGGTIEAYGGAGAYGIGAGKGGIGGKFSTGDGNPVIITNSISDQNSESVWNGVFIVDSMNGGVGKIYGNKVTPTNDFAIPAGKTLEVDADQSLIIAKGITATNNGTVIRDKNGVVDVRGKWLGNPVIVKGEEEGSAVTGVTLNKRTLALKPGENEILMATVSPATAANKSLRWTSSNTDVATIDANGKVNAVANGMAVITVSTVDGGFMAQCTVTVSEKQTEVVAVENVKLNKTSLTLDIGESESLKATVTPEEAANKNVTWSSNDEDVASVDAKGKVTAISRGTATITVRTENGNFAAQCKVTVTDPNATTTDTETQPDGSTVTTVEDVNGSSSSTIVDVNGVVDTSVTLSDSAVSDAAKNDTAVILPMVGVKASTDIASAPSVTVDLPGNTPVQVEIPVLDMTPGTVAVLVDKNGNETILKNSVLGNNGLIVTLSDGETVKILDNTQTFSDVDSSHWAKNNIDYVTSRGLFVGTSASEFAPETPMSRAMIVSVLQRYEGDDTAASPGEDWYEGARQWAMEAGISDGSDMMGNVTREQLVTMLYRYIGSPQMIGGLNSYSDVSSVSSYAEQAMVWAVRNGIIGGMTADTLAPQGMATRAQVAAILQRFIAWEQTA